MAWNANIAQIAQVTPFLGVPGYEKVASNDFTVGIGGIPAANMAADLQLANTALGEAGATTRQRMVNEYNTWYANQVLKQNKRTNALTFLGNFLGSRGMGSGQDYSNLLQATGLGSVLNSRRTQAEMERLRQERNAQVTQSAKGGLDAISKIGS